ncbi:MAG: Kdo hydroxylase family protein [Deltaproteobacteria bacterium]|nr:Kdo hydroxylase family protein [Deltaproteobacteria bacterium]
MIELCEAKDLTELVTVRERAREILENGGVVHLPNLVFELTLREREIVDPKRPLGLRLGKARNTGRPTLLFYQHTGRLRGGALKGVPSSDLKEMLNRFADWTRHLVRTLLPDSADQLEQEFTTFRPCARSRTQALHMDAALARPTQGRCMLRVFRNVNGGGVPRVWQVGGHFESGAERFVARLPTKVRERIPGASALFHLLGISKGPATAYDHTMRLLRDLMTTDKEFQRSAPRMIVEFPAGSTWLAFTDLALHGAVSGQHSLDQTFLMNPSGMRDPNRSSLRILERLTGRTLV